MTNDLHTRLDGLIAYHQHKATYWAGRKNARQTATHYDAITTIKEARAALSLHGKVKP